MKFVLLAAGKSKRLYKKIKKNKCLLKLGNKTLKKYNTDIIFGYSDVIISKKF